MKVKSESEVAQSCPTLSDPMDYSPPGPPSMGFSRQEYWSGVPLSIGYCREVNDNLLQYACLVNAKERGACHAAVHGVTELYTNDSRVNRI